MLQTTDQLKEELLRLMKEVDRDMGPEPNHTPQLKSLDRTFLSTLKA
jgi:hypothetical protein